MARPAIAAVLYISLRMTFDAPWHPHRCDTGDTVHCFDRTVTFLTFEAGLDMPLMREVNIVGNVVYLDPRYWFAIFPVSRQFHDLRTVADSGQRFVTAHAFAHARYAGDGRPGGIDMAILARNFVIRGMNRVAEFDWLNRTAIGKKLAVYPGSRKQSEHEQ